MDRVTVLVTLVVSLFSSCHGAYPKNDGYLPPKEPCENVTINIASTMFVTETELLPPYVNTRVLEPDTLFKPMPPHTSTTTMLVTTLEKKRTIIKKKHQGGCKTTLPPLTVTNTIPVFITKFLEPLKITEASKILVWMTVPPVTTTVLVTTTIKEDAKFKISMKTELHNTTIGPDTVEMTMPITFTELLAPMTSTVTDQNVHTTTLPAITVQIPPETIMKDPSTVTSTVIITHTEVIPPDTKMVTWTITQIVNTKCQVTYNYNSPTIPFPKSTPKSLAPSTPFIIQPVETRTLNPVRSEGETSGLPGDLFDVLNASTIWT